MNTMKIDFPGFDDFLTQEAYKVLRTNLQFCGADIKVVQLTAYGENEGKTTVAMQIARSFAELGKKVILIDADMRKSVMAGRNTNAKPKCGLSEYLSGLADLETCTWATQEPSFDILFSGKFPPNPVELLSGVKFRELLELLREQYDYVFIDTPPLGLVVDAAVTAPLCDGTVVILGDANLKYRQVESVLEQIRRTGGRTLGVVKNKLSGMSHRYYSAHS